jgi:hypothetical protein
VIIIGVCDTSVKSGPRCRSGEVSRLLGDLARLELRLEGDFITISGEGASFITRLDRRGVPISVGTGTGAPISTSSSGMESKVRPNSSLRPGVSREPDGTFLSGENAPSSASILRLAVLSGIGDTAGRFVLEVETIEGDLQYGLA